MSGRETFGLALVAFVAMLQCGAREADPRIPSGDVNVLVGDVRLDVALSAKSESGAERNLAAETRGKSFAEVRAAATAASLFGFVRSSVSTTNQYGRRKT